MINVISGKWVSSTSSCLPHGGANDINAGYMNGNYLAGEEVDSGIISDSSKKNVKLRGAQATLNPVWLLQQRWDKWNFCIHVCHVCILHFSARQILYHYKIIAELQYRDIIIIMGHILLARAQLIYRFTNIIRQYRPIADILVYIGTGIIDLVSADIKAVF